MKNSCQKCAYEWMPRSENRSKQCPHCRCKRWDDPKYRRYNFNFEGITFFDRVVIPWPEIDDDRPRLYRAMKVYEYRKKVKFDYTPTPLGMEIIRIA